MHQRIEDGEVVFGLLMVGLSTAPRHAALLGLLFDATAKIVVIIA